MTMTTTTTNTDAATDGESSDDDEQHDSRIDCQEAASYAETDRTVTDPAAGWTASVEECGVCGRERYAWTDDDSGELMEVEFKRPDGTTEFTDRHY